eukprot:TRINITY_DN65951_c0_g1_i1.p1 TRINITY_DN65951_c0_g1~~TRINITY_DN65951_c0_g1_i1.p1  ORF type:complete len:261 (-),score=51.66 TRINITY_DN65951_c0_g1_i1:180-962(-)
MANAETAGLVAPELSKKELRDVCRDLTELIRKNSAVFHDAAAAEAGDLEVDLSNDGTVEAGDEGSCWSASLLLGSSGGERDGFQLWLGGIDDAVDIATLKSKGVTAMLNMAVGDCERDAAEARRKPTKYTNPALAAAEFSCSWCAEALGCEDLLYLGVDAEDSSGYAIYEDFGRTTAFLEQCEAANRSVLVHCRQGVNRSAAVCAAFLLRRKSGLSAMSVRDAVDWISQRRPDILTNTNFLRQLVVHGAGCRGTAAAVDA